MFPFGIPLAFEGIFLWFFQAEDPCLLRNLTICCNLEATSILWKGPRPWDEDQLRFFLRRKVAANHSNANFRGTLSPLKRLRFMRFQNFMQHFPNSTALSCCTNLDLFPSVLKRIATMSLLSIGVYGHVALKRCDKSVVSLDVLGVGVPSSVQWNYEEDGLLMSFFESWCQFLTCRCQSASLKSADAWLFQPDLPPVA